MRYSPDTAPKFGRRAVALALSADQGAGRWIGGTAFWSLALFIVVSRLVAIDVAGWWDLAVHATRAVAPR